jgi:hypothetical protein
MWGRIRPLALVRKRDDDWIKVREIKRSELGETGLVFWPAIPRDQGFLEGNYVRFKVEPNAKSRNSEDNHDEFIVAEDGRNGSSSRVDTLGWPVLSEKHISVPDRILSSHEILRPETIIYRRRLKDTLIDGPWRVFKLPDPLRLGLMPKEDGFVR